MLFDGANDGKVTVASTKVAGMAGHVTIETSHTRLIRHPEALDAVLVFLREGRFRTAPAPGSSAV